MVLRPWNTRADWRMIARCQRNKRHSPTKSARSGSRKPLARPRLTRPRERSIGLLRRSYLCQRKAVLIAAIGEAGHKAFDG